jgi:hypothetical protein
MHRLLALTLETPYQPGAATQTAMGRLDIPCDSTACGDIGGFAVFKWHVSPHPDQEAVVPISSSDQNKAVLAFDNRNGYQTGVAIVQPKFLSLDSGMATVFLLIRDQGGNQLAVDALQIVAGGHTSFLLADKYSVVAGQSGTVEFSSTESVAALGLMFNDTGALTTIPAFYPE